MSHFACPILDTEISDRNAVYICMRFAHCARSSAYYCGFVSYRGWKSTPSALNCGTVLRRMSNENEMRHQDGVFMAPFLLH